MEIQNHMLGWKSPPGEKSGNVGVLQLQQPLQDRSLPVPAVCLSLSFAFLESDETPPPFVIRLKHRAKASRPGASEQRIDCAIVEPNRRWKPEGCERFGAQVRQPHSSCRLLTLQLYLA